MEEVEREVALVGVEHENMDMVVGMSYKVTWWVHYDGMNEL